MKDWINAWLANWAFKWHATVVMVRYQTGRWYVFRDRPDWFVEQAAGLLQRAQDEGEEYAATVLEQAANEWRLRQRQRQ